VIIFNRRSFLKTGLAALPLASISDISVQGLPESKHPSIDSGSPGKIIAPNTTTDRAVEFVIPRIDDYEVAAIHCS
jgi:hypothetical protein